MAGGGMAGAGAGADHPVRLPEGVPVEDVLTFLAAEILATADLEVVSNDSIRRQMEKDLGTDLEAHKDFVNNLVSRFLDGSITLDGVLEAPPKGMKRGMFPDENAAVDAPQPRSARRPAGVAGAGAAEGAGGAGHQGPPVAGEAGVLAPGDEDWRDWAGGVPVDVLAKVAETHVAQTEAGWAAQLKEWGDSEKEIQEEVAKRERDGNSCLFVLAMVCKPWRTAQLKVGGPLRTRVFSDVAMPGGLELVKWALAEGCPREGGWPYSNIARAAAQHGHLELVKWLCREGGFEMDDWVMMMAARGGNVELVRWLRGEGCDWSARTCEFAATAGRLGVLQWLRAEGCPWNADTCDLAARYGHLETLRWARENGCHWTSEACAWAGYRGHLEVLQYLRANGCPWTWKTCTMAAEFGHLETLRWARENGCDWTAGTCAAAASGGQLEVLQWLRAEGCPWNKHTCRLAVGHGHVEVLRWARENGAPWDAATRDWAADKLGYTDDLGNLVG